MAKMPGVRRKVSKMAKGPTKRLKKMVKRTPKQRNNLRKGGKYTAGRIKGI